MALIASRDKTLGHGYGGERIAMHRALRYWPFKPRSGLEGAFVSLAFMAVYVLAYPWLENFWVWALQTGVQQLRLDVLVGQAPLELPWGLPSVKRWCLVGPAAEVGWWGWGLQAVVVGAVARASCLTPCCCGTPASSWTPMAKLWSRCH